MATQSDFFARWFPGEINHSVGFHKILAAQLPNAGKILDLGCGNNAALGTYRTAEREVWGADFSAHPALQHSEWFRKLAPTGAIPFADETFDIVASFMVMEHVAEPAAFLGEIARVLKPGGVYIGQSIHALHYVTWIRRAFDLVPHRWIQRLVKKLYGREEHDTFPTCYRLNTQGALAHAACDASLKLATWTAYLTRGISRSLLCSIGWQ
jgi:ubiquinone/menaquinone biosynthesis C-methylase UbiE